MPWADEDLCLYPDRWRAQQDLCKVPVPTVRRAATTTAGTLAQGTPVFIGADEDAGEVLHVMEKHRIRRLPVIDNHRLVGMISEADLSRHLSGRPSAISSRRSAQAVDAVGKQG